MSDVNFASHWARPVLKVCCIASIEEAQLAIQAGANILGLVSAMPSGPGPLPDALIAQIAAAVPAPTQTFLLTCLIRAIDIAAQHRAARTTGLQLVDHVSHNELRQLRQLCPSARLVQVIHVLDETSIDEARAVAPLVDALLLDSGNPRLRVKELGGTGRAHNWATSARIVQAVHPLPVFLAGGLDASNVAQALAQVRPHGVDVCSRVRTNDLLDSAKLSALVSNLGAGPQHHAKPKPCAPMRNQP